MGASTMRSKIGTAEFNQHLFGLINAAMSDGQMGPFEINGALFAGMAYVDRSAMAAAKVAQDRKQSDEILQVKTMPPLPPIKPPK